MEGGNIPIGLVRKETDCGGYNIGKAKVYNGKNCSLSATELNALKCSMCTLLLKEPCQVIVCGHRYCKACIDHLTSGGEGPFSCLVDQEQFQKHEVRADKGCLRDLKRLEVDCPTDPPCDWRGKLLDVETHKETCCNKRSLCVQGCGLLFTAAVMQQHMTTECSKRPCACEYCNKEISYDAIQEHYGVCEEHPVLCDYCQKELPARKLLSEHLDQDCEEYYMQCHSCDYKGRKPDMMVHVMTKHLIQSLNQMAEIETKVIAIELENKALRQELANTQSSVSDLQAETKQLKIENQQKDVDIASLKSIVEQLQKERDERDLALVVKDRGFGDFVERDGPNLSGGADPHKYDVSKLLSEPDLYGSQVTKFRAPDIPAAQLKGLNPDLVHECILSLTDHVPDVARPGAELHRVKQAVEGMKTKLEKVNDIVQSTQDNQTRYGIAIDEIRLRQDVLDVKTTNGVLIWKIPDIRRRYRDAVDRRTISLYSPPFYTSPHGYRMCIRTYLNGDGIGKGTHLSLFFVVMRSEHDNLLPWPFRQSVRFTLINQKNRPSSITEAFMPDLNSPSFHKPESDMNIASGFPKFARQSVLSDDNYTDGNMIFIKCQVDLTGLPAL